MNALSGINNKALQLVDYQYILLIVSGGPPEVFISLYVADMKSILIDVSNGTNPLIPPSNDSPS